MFERRQIARARVIYGGVLAYNRRQSTMNCVIRNFSDDGAKVEFENSGIVARCRRDPDRKEKPRLYCENRVAPG